MSNTIDTDSKHPDAISIPDVQDQLAKARGIIVMATTTPGTQPIAVPIFEPPLHSPAFQADWKELQKGLKKCGKKGRPTRLELLTSIFEESWAMRKGEVETRDAATIADFLLFGNAILDEVPLRHIALVSVNGRVKVMTPAIADRNAFMVWKDAMLPDIQALFGPKTKSIPSANPH